MLARVRRAGRAFCIKRADASDDDDDAAAAVDRSVDHKSAKEVRTHRPGSTPEEWCAHGLHVRMHVWCMCVCALCPPIGSVHPTHKRMLTGHMHGVA